MYKCICLFAQLDLNVAQRRVFLRLLCENGNGFNSPRGKLGCHAPSINIAQGKWRHFCLLKSATWKTICTHKVTIDKWIL